MMMIWYSTCLLLLVLFRTNGKNVGSKHHLPSEVALWKLHDHCYVQSRFSTNTRHIDNSILKDILQFFILRIWINMRAKSFIKTSVNVTETRIDEGAWKKIGTQSVHLEEHCTKIETTFHLFYALLFLINLVFKFNLQSVS